MSKDRARCRSGRRRSPAGLGIRASRGPRDALWWLGAANAHAEDIPRALRQGHDVAHRAKQQSMERGFGAIAPRRERSSARRVSSLLLLVRCGRLRHTGGHARIRQVAGARRRRCPVWRWRTGRREARAGRAARCPVASPSGTRALAAEHRTELVGGAWRRARRRWGGGVGLWSGSQVAQHPRR
jgi:hypothetical protein